MGGNVATNAGGPRCLKYGVTRNYVIGLEVVLANGDVLRTGGRVHKNKTGFDLIGLFVGSEGMLGVVTEITVKLLPMPPARATLSAVVREHAGGGGDGAENFRRRLSAVVARDRGSFHPRSCAARFRPGGCAAQGTRICSWRWMASRKRCGWKWKNCAHWFGLQSDRARTWRRRKPDCERLWALRREFSNSLRATGLTKLNQDIVVPRSRLVDLVEFAEALSQAIRISDRLLRSRGRWQHSRQHHGGPVRSGGGRAGEGGASARRTVRAGAGVGRGDHRRTRHRAGEKAVVAGGDERSRA